MSRKPRLNLEMGARRITLAGRRHRFEITDRGPMEAQMCVACGEEPADKGVRITVPTQNIIYPNVGLCPSCRVDYDTGRVVPKPEGGFVECAVREGCFTLVEGECVGGPSCPRYEPVPHDHVWVADNPRPVSEAVRCARCGHKADVGLEHFEREAYAQNIVGGDQ